MDVFLSLLVGFGLGWYFKGRGNSSALDVTFVNPEPAEKPTAHNRLSEEKYLSNSQWQHLYGLCEGILADDVVTDSEAKRLRKWFKANPEGQKDVRSKELHTITDIFLADDQLDKDESNELFTQLSEFCDRWAAPEPKAKPYSARATKQSNKSAPTKPTKSAKSKSQKNWTDYLDLVGHDLDISYMSADGDMSDRTVACKDIEYSGDHIYIKGYCKSRRAYRTFRTDRIIMLVNTSTGEIIDT